ncbi:MAG TPA: malonyl-CoA synthase [Burkholderiales bacterium]|nr:malonyl-CoA synthase [Burkholderiales bacterium]
MTANFYEALAAVLQADPGRPLLETEDGRVHVRADAERESARYARLLAEAGARPGDRVAVQVEKSPAALFLYLACLRAGCVYLPLNTAYQRGELAYFLGDAEPAVIVARPESADLMRELCKGRARVYTLDENGSGSLTEAATLPQEFAPVARGPDDLAVILYTSGTTGRSKGAMVTHGNLASNARVLVDAWAFSERDTLLHALPIFHIHGLFVANHCALLSGARMLWHRKFDSKAVLRHLPRASVMMGVPTFYTRLLAEPAFGRDACGGMRLFICGSAPLLPETFAQFESRAGQRILERYGMSEAGMICSNPLDGERRSGSVGRPLPGGQLRIAGEDDRPLPAGGIGGIQIRGANVFAGYWRMPEKTREEFTADGWFRTGDVGTMDAGGYVCIVGRAKDLIISGGYNVYPKEIELAIDVMPGVAESAVIGVPHPDFGEAVTAVVVPRAGAKLDAVQLIAALRRDLANYKVPKQVHFVDDLPRNAMGKVQKALLRERYGKRGAR